MKIHIRYLALIENKYFLKCFDKYANFSHEIYMDFEEGINYPLMLSLHNKITPSTTCTSPITIIPYVKPTQNWEKLPLNDALFQ